MAGKIETTAVLEISQEELLVALIDAGWPIERNCMINIERSGTGLKLSWKVEKEVVRKTVNHPR